MYPAGLSDPSLGGLSFGFASRLPASPPKEESQVGDGVNRRVGRGRQGSPSRGRRRSRVRVKCHLLFLTSLPQRVPFDPGRPGEKKSK